MTMKCPETDPVCQSLTGDVPAQAVEYVAVSAQPFAGAVEIVAVVALVVAVLLLLRWIVVWERGL